MINTIHAYLKANIDETASIQPWIDGTRLPLILAEKFTFYEINLLETTFLLLEPLNKAASTSELQNDAALISARINKPVVYSFDTISQFKRKKMIQAHLPFLVENGQMYLPFLGLDINQQLKNQSIRKEQLTPTAQMLYLYWLYHPDWVINATRLAARLDVTSMYAGMVINELYAKNLLTYAIGGATGRSKNYSRIPDPEYYRRGREFLVNPISRIVYADLPPGSYRFAGLDALSRCSMLNPPEQAIVAISRKQAKQLALKPVTEIDIIQAENLPAVQIWKYDPVFVTDADHVDVLSLALSLQPLKDERVEQALEGLLKEQPWYTD